MASFQSGVPTYGGSNPSNQATGGQQQFGAGAGHFQPSFQQQHGQPGQQQGAPGAHFQSNAPAVGQQYQAQNSNAQYAGQAQPQGGQFPAPGTSHNPAPSFGGQPSQFVATMPPSSTPQYSSGSSQGGAQGQYNPSQIQQQQWAPPTQQQQPWSQQQPTSAAPAGGAQQPPFQSAAPPVQSTYQNQQYQQQQQQQQQPQYAHQNQQQTQFQPGAAPPFMPGQPQQQPNPAQAQPQVLATGTGISSPQQIDPRQIPSPTSAGDIDGDDAASLVHAPPVYRASSMQPPPRATSRFVAVDDGNCPPTHMRVSMYNFPASADLAAQACLPPALLVQPFAPVSPGQPPVPVVDAGPEGPPRCRRCRAYLNCHCKFVAGGNEFVCPLCHVQTELPPAYRAPLGPDGRRADHDARPELCRGVVDFVATAEYMLRSPQPPSCVFVVDVGARSLATGLVDVLVEAIRRAVTSLTPDSRVGLIAYDDRLHFFNLRASAPQPAMLVVPDLTSPFVPLPHDVMLLPLAVCQDQLNSLLDCLPALFADRQAAAEASGAPGASGNQRPAPQRSLAVGAAIAAGCEALKDVGGKMLVFATGLPTAPPGALSSRETSSLYGTDGEASLLRPQKDRGFYASLGNTCAGASVRVDMVLLASDYVDVATLASLPRRTGGQLYYYSSFVRSRDEARLNAELARNLAGPFGFEALVRVRCSEGFSVAKHHGHFRALNSTDLEVAGVDANYTLACTLSHDDKVDERGQAFVQCAVLYTSATGQRRIRVLTLAFNATTSVANVFRGADLDVVVNVLVRRAAESLVAGSGSLKTARAGVVSACVKALAAYRKHCAPTTASGQLILPESLKLLPIYTLAATRSALLRRGTNVSADERAFQLTAFGALPVGAAPVMLYPRLYALHDMDEICGMTRLDAVQWLQQQQQEQNVPVVNSDDPDAFDIVLPPQCPLGAEQLSPNGVFLLTTGVHVYLWFGQQVDPGLLYNLLGVDSLRDLDLHAMGELPVYDNPDSQRYRSVIDELRGHFPCYRPAITFVRQAEPSEVRFFSHFVEDKSSEGMSYVDFLVEIHRQIHKQLQ